MSGALLLCIEGRVREPGSRECIGARGSERADVGSGEELNERILNVRRRSKPGGCVDKHASGRIRSTLCRLAMRHAIIHTAYIQSRTQTVTQIERALNAQICGASATGSWTPGLRAVAPTSSRGGLVPA